MRTTGSRFCLLLLCFAVVLASASGPAGGLAAEPPQRRPTLDSLTSQMRLNLLFSFMVEGYKTGASSQQAAYFREIENRSLDDERRAVRQLADQMRSTGRRVQAVIRTAQRLELRERSSSVEWLDNMERTAGERIRETAESWRAAEEFLNRIGQGEGVDFSAPDYSGVVEVNEGNPDDDCPQNLASCLLTVSNSTNSCLGSALAGLDAPSDQGGCGAEVGNCWYNVDRQTSSNGTPFFVGVYNGCNEPGRAAKNACAYNRTTNSADPIGAATDACNAADRSGNDHCNRQFDCDAERIFEIEDWLVHPIELRGVLDGLEGSLREVEQLIAELEGYARLGTIPVGMEAAAAQYVLVLVRFNQIAGAARMGR